MALSAPRLLAVVLAAVVLASCAVDEVVAPPGAASLNNTTGVRLVLVSGGGQRGVAGQPLPQPVVVRVLDQRGRPVPGATVNFLAGSWGTADPRQARTDSLGLASTRWTLGPVPGAQQLRVSGTGGTVLVMATASPGRGRLYLVKVSGDEQVAPVSTTLPRALEVRVVRDDGKPAPASVVVRWRVLTGGGAVSATSTRTVNGSTSTRWTLGPVVGVQRVEASAAAAGAGAVEFTATGTVPPPPAFTVTQILKRVASPAYGAIDVSRQSLVVNFWPHLSARGDVRQLTVRGPTGQRIACTGMQPWNALRLEFWCQMYLDRGLAPGVWQVDSLWTSAYQGFSATDLNAMNTVGRRFDVYNTTVVDRSPPQVRTVWSDGRGSDPTTYWVNMGVIDHVSGVRAVTAAFGTPQGTTLTCAARTSTAPLALVSGWLCPLRFPAGAGRYRLLSITVVDGAGNSATYTPGQIDASVKGVFESTFLKYEYDL